MKTLLNAPIAFVIVALTLAAPAARVEASGKTAAVNAIALYTTVISVPANSALTLETLNLSPSTADSVIHVNLTDGTFVAGNDDFSGFASRVQVPASASAMTYRIVVRGYSAASAGSGTLRITIGSNAASDRPIIFGGTTISVPSWAAGAQFQTVERQDGTSDTVLLLISGSTATAVAVDDDGGVGYMSKVRSNQGCAGGCQIVVGAYSTTGTTDLVQDDGGADSDADGLSNNLEAALATNASDTDTDHDGLADANEVYGAEVVPVAKLPAWGASPTAPDLFLEADWMNCQPDASGAGCGSPADHDIYRMTGAAVSSQAQMFAPEIRAHFDIGVVNSDPATRTTWGAWGGAGRVDTDDGKYCGGWTEGWKKIFHHVLLAGQGGGGQTLDKPCSIAGWAAVGHEVGHQVGLAHGGGDSINCKPHYRSEMSYIYSYSVGTFSRNQFGAAVLNPTNLDETKGVFSSASATAFLGNAPWSYKVNSSGGVDWNRDGVISSGATRGAPQWTGQWADCNVGAYGAALVDQGSVYTATVWAKGPQRLYMFSRDPSGNIVYRYTTKASLDSCNALSTQGPPGSCVTWSAAKTLVTNAGSLSGPFGVDWVHEDKQDKIMLAQVHTNTLEYRMMTFDASNNEVWSAPTSLTGTPFGVGGVSVVTIDPNVYVFTASATTTGGWALKSWRYSATSKTWTTQDRIEKWSNGSNVDSFTAPGVTVGYVKGVTGAQVVAALEDVNNGLKLARYDTSKGKWVELSGVIPAGWTSNARPALAYVPFKSTDKTVGRYYFLYSPIGNVPAIALTEGNDPASAATTKRLRIFNNTMLWDEWKLPYSSPFLTDAPFLSYDLRWGLDTNLRASLAFAGDSPLVHFFPLADGVVNIPLKDFDDYGMALSRLNSSL